MNIKANNMVGYYLPLMIIGTCAIAFDSVMGLTTSIGQGLFIGCLIMAVVAICEAVVIAVRRKLGV